MEPDLEIVGESANGIDAMEVVSQLSPDLVVIDIALPGRSGIDFTRCLREAGMLAKVLVLTSHRSEEYIRAALDAGAHGYVLKDASRAELLQAVRTVLAGQTYLSPSVTATVISGYLHGNAVESAATVTEQVTNREREVLVRIALGQSNRLIARFLGVSVKSIEKHRSNLKRKLTLHNTAAMTRFAISHGMVTAELETAVPDIPGD